MGCKIKSGSGFIVDIDELGTPYMTTDENEATVFDDFAADFALSYLEDAGFVAQIVEV